MSSGKGPLRIAIEDFIETFGIGERFSNWLRSGVEQIEGEIFGDTEEVLALVLQDLQEVPELRAVISKLFSGTAPAGALALGGFALSMGTSAASGLLTPVLRAINYRIDRSLHTARPDPSVYFALKYRNPDEARLTTDLLRDLGWHEDLIDAWETTLRPIVSEADLLTLWRRGTLPEGQLDQELAARGWPQDRITQIKEATELRPGVQDIITMAVREAFTPDVIRQFQLDAELPPIYTQEAAKIGMPKEFSDRFWFAHWQLPSLGQGFEMFHRLRPGTTDVPFELDDLRTLVKTQDISPFFRDRLIQIAFAPYTRVDVRRMFRDGILDENQVFEAYLDLGYNDEKATNLTAWTVRESRTEEKNLTRAAIVKGYKKKVLTRDQAEEGLRAIGYPEDQVAFWISLADLELAEARADEIIDGVEFLFVNGQIDLSLVYDRLGPLNLPAEQIDDLLTVWQIKREAKTALPGRGELEEFYERDIITEDQFMAGLIERRYRPEQAQWYIDKSDLDILNKAQVEAERAAKEQERIAVAALASAYAQDKAELDVQIAELRLTKAEITLAIKEVVDPKEKADLKVRKAEQDVLIRELQVTKAELRHDLEEELGE